ncbi:hypothetical protein AAFC00_005339 [Neodothiora populina]|uniref:Chitinase n=1 Tax=Neodothiora populina TaxID=2781224 RepID=A0ABR3PKS3_9PEZI
MSWMDSCSRPRKSAATPPPYYLTQGTEARYCHSCGRTIGSRKKSTSTEVKYCSDRCKRHKLRPVDRQIEAAFAALLDGREALGVQVDNIESDEAAAASAAAGAKREVRKVAKGKKVKGDPRILVPCSEVEELIFGSNADPEKVFGRKKNRARRGVPDDEVWKSVDMEGSSGGSDTDLGSTHSEDQASMSAVPEAEEGPDGGIPLCVRPAQSKSLVNGSIGGEKGWAERIEETPEMILKRREGQKKADQREMVRCAARRAVVFGLRQEHKEEKREKGGKAATSDDGLRLCEAVMNGAVVEPSFAKGDWAIRWRAD